MARLSGEAETEASDIAYDGSRGQVEFDWTFDKTTEITGYIALRLWVEERDSCDMIVCGFIEKLDEAGSSVRFHRTAGQDQDVGSRVYRRAARRALDAVQSRRFHAAFAGDRDDWLGPGQIVRLDIAFVPSATSFAPGETLRMVLAGRDEVHRPIFRNDTSAISGTHVLRFGGVCDAHPLVSFIPQGYAT